MLFEVGETDLDMVVFATIVNVGVSLELHDNDKATRRKKVADMVQGV